MTCNLGHNERAVRIGLGMVLIAAAGFVRLPQWGVWVMYMAGVAALVSGLVGFCLVWRLLGINTCGAKISARS